MELAREQGVAQTMPAGAIAAGLACLFAGIWTSDGAALELLNPPGGDLAMRIASLIAYAALFIGVRLRLHGAKPERRDSQRFLALATGTALVAYILGSVIMLGTGSLDGSTHTVAALSALLLLKCIGAPSTVTFVRLCTALPYRSLAQISALGILGAFMLKEAVSALAALAQFSTLGMFAIGSALILLSIGLVSLKISRLRTLPEKQKNAQLQEPATKLLPIGVLANRNLAAGMVVASMMLGFLRTSSSIEPAASPFVTIITFAIITMAVSLLPNVGMHELFRGALVCTAAGFLLAPALNLFVAGGSDVLVGIGTALFEVVVWAVTVVIARSCDEPLLAATAARLVTVIGHLAGATLGMLAGAGTEVHAIAPETFSLAIVFAYVIMLVYLFNDPVAKLPFTTGHVAVPQPPTAVEPAEASAPTSSRSWEARCAAIAHEHGLTPRETDMLEQLARGRDLAFMEEKFVLSRNTVKMHIKHVYEKLDVHSKQEVIDLVESAHL